MTTSGTASGFPDLPRLDGALLTDEATRRQFSSDLALNVRRMPRGVLRPGSAEDVAAMVRYANKHQLKIAMRGQGHSRYGQTLAGDGIVVDSGTLNRVLGTGDGWVEAEAGAFWEDVTQACLKQGRTPPLLGTCPWLAVGGLLSAGGYSNRSHRLGGVVDSVLELEVVTGAGERVTCSEEQNRELFEMALAGMCQIALMVRVRLQTVAAPETVVRQDLLYEDLGEFLKDAERLAVEAPYDHLNARAVRRADGGWNYTINVGRFYYPGEEPEWFLETEKWGCSLRTEPMRASYEDYVYREAAKNIQEKARRRAAPSREPSLVLFIPASATGEFMAELLASPAAWSGLADYQFNPFSVRRFRRPLFRFPDEDVAFGFWLYPRNVGLQDAAAYEAATEANRQMVERMLRVGGKLYPPYAPYHKPAEWEAHYGEELWARLQVAKQIHDPNRVLTPQMGMFEEVAADSPMVWEQE